MPKKCPKSAINAGAHLVKLRRMGADVEAQRRIAYDAVKAAQADIPESKVMQMGTALKNLSAIGAVEGLAGEAHNSLRTVLVECGYSEPTDAEIMAVLGPEPRGGGGGGGRGR